MTFSEDPASPPAPFSGDGSIFDQPDVLMNLPTTNERVVETQSGFLLVIRRMGERLALSCKRHVGTPPSSNILLTPDESVRFSRILAASIVGLEDSSPSGGFVQPGRRRLPFSAPVPQSAGGARRLKAPLLALSAVAVLAAMFVAGMSYSKYAAKSSAKSAAPVADADVLSAVNVDKFARRFVSEMLDFDPQTYRMSQVQAMAVMSPDLLQKYWKETNFPLSQKQLASLPQETTVAIDKIEQERTASDLVTADIYAQLVHNDARMGTPLHIKLKLTQTDEHRIRVIEQQDLSGQPDEKSAAEAPKSGPTSEKSAAQPAQSSQTNPKSVAEPQNVH